MIPLKNTVILNSFEELTTTILAFASHASKRKRDKEGGKKEGRLRQLIIDI